MAEYIHTQSGARVSVADGKELGMGFTPFGGEPERSEAPDKSWKVAELKAHAEEHDIDLGEATKKDDILAVLAGVADGKEDGEPNGGPGTDEHDDE